MEIYYKAHTWELILEEESQISGDATPKMTRVKLSSQGRSNKMLQALELS
jgi:hypothetical protein